MVVVETVLAGHGDFTSWPSMLDSDTQAGTISDFPSAVARLTKRPAESSAAAGRSQRT